MTERRENERDHQEVVTSKTEITAVEIVWQSPWVRAIFFLALGILVMVMLWRFRSGYTFVLQVGIVGFVMAYILNPVVNALGRIRIGRALAVVLVYIVLLQLLVLGSILVGQVVVQLGDFVSQIPRALDSIGSLFGHLQPWFNGVLENLPTFLSDRLGVENNDQFALQVREQVQIVLSQAVEGIAGALEQLVAGGPGLLLSGATNILSATLQFFLILLTSAYFLYDFPRFTANFRRFVPVRWRPLYGDLVQKADRAVGGYLRGQLLITTVLGIFIFIGLSIIRVPLALTIGFLAAIFNLVPYLGPIIGAVPAILLGFTVSPLTALLAVLVFIIANQLEGHLLSPLILSRSVNLHPVTVLLAIMAGLGLLGFVGALLAVPLVALGKVILEEYLLTRPPYQGEPERLPPATTTPPEGNPEEKPAGGVTDAGR